ncbi:hypothetical protein B0I35DRAFT_194105 [Stachybotrys elegans]|uniref:FAD/NAD(P)-binding domain-containing protein n=1 Tax=Stachybotrys elegans TaxID=80388 RepID=A0A8K0T1S5_9HYPO|nr:hypothetical protein B0I35DRAFT_194105 [Stachybotrys elegans]
MSPSADMPPSTNGHGSNGINGTNGHDARSPYTISETLLGSRRPIKVIVVGFGMSGIHLSYILGKQLKNTNITLQFYERNPELGGTWFENRYPGCACDIPSVNYQFSWAPSMEWSGYYASHSEILAYLKNVVAEHNLDNCLKLNHKVTGAFWEADNGRWRVRVEPNGDPAAEFDDYAEIVINATGILNHWKWPDIAGLEKFKNRVHTAAWDDSIVLKDKRVGVIGNGSSSVQVVSAICDEVEHIETFVRSSMWVTPPWAFQHAENNTDMKYSEEQKKFFRENPDEYLAYRKRVEREMNPNFDTCITGTEIQVARQEYASKAMHAALQKKPELIEKLIPTTYGIGCRRPVPDNGYLKAITSDKCDVIFTPISEITEEGIITEDSVEHKFDVLVCGTGFDATYKPRFPVVGQNGLDMREAFSELPDCYLSTMVPEFPNYMMILGPYAPHGHGSVVPFIEAATRNIAMVLEKFQTQNIKSLAPKKEAADDWKEHRQEFMKRTIWSAPCRTWFKLGPKGDDVMMWPGSRLHSFHAMLNPRWEDYNWEYLGRNRFSYFGNGFTVMDREEESLDKAWYIAGI